MDNLFSYPYASQVTSTQDESERKPGLVNGAVGRLGRSGFRCQPPSIHFHFCFEFSSFIFGKPLGPQDGTPHLTWLNPPISC